MFRRDVGGAMNPAVILRHFSIYTLEVTVDRLTKVLAHHTHHAEKGNKDHSLLYFSRLRHGFIMTSQRVMIVN